MKITSLHITNFKGARRVDIHEPDPTCNEIAGENGAGKSSILDGIIAALAGTRHVQAQPLTMGTTKGCVELTLDDLQIKRTLTAKNQASGGRLTIKAADGRKVGQTDLSGLLGEFTKDPTAFAGKAVRDQVNDLQALAGEEFCSKLAELDGRIAGLTARRPELKRELQRFGAIPNLPEAHSVDTAALMNALAQWDQFDDHIRARQHAIRALKDEQLRVTDDLGKCEQRIANLMRQLEDERENRTQLQRQAEKVRVDVAAQELALKEVPGPANIASREMLSEQLRTAGETNHAAAAYRAAEEQRAAKRLVEDELVQCERKLERLRADREALALTAELPVPGLAWDDAGVTLNGVPFDQLSASEQLRLSARIGMAVGAGAQIMLVRDGSLLGDKALAELVQLAKDSGWQLWIETVGKGHEDALVITEGELDDGRGEL